VTSEASDVVRKLIPSQLPTVRTATCQITTPEASPDPLELVQLLDPELDEESSTGSKSRLVTFSDQDQVIMRSVSEESNEKGLAASSKTMAALTIESAFLNNGKKGIILYYFLRQYKLLQKT
jgi:hypothetical protein